MQWSYEGTEKRQMIRSPVVAHASEYGAILAYNLGTLVRAVLTYRSNVYGVFYLESDLGHSSLSGLPIPP